MSKKEKKIGFYLDSHPTNILPKEKQIELFKELSLCDDKSKSEITSILFESNVRLIHTFLYKFFKGSVGKACQNYRMTYDDMFSIGCEILLKSIYKFDPARGFQFTTLFYKMLFNGYIKYFSRLRGVQPTDVSLDKAWDNQNEDNDLTLLDTIFFDPDNLDPVGDAVSNDLIGLLTELQKTSKPRDFRALQMSIGGMSQEDIGKQLGISQVQVSRILRKIRNQAINIRDTLEKIS